MRKQATLTTTVIGWVLTLACAGTLAVAAQDAGNEIIELDQDVQLQVKTEAVGWGRQQGEANPWFKKAYASQLAYEQLGKDATRYRNVASPQ